MTHKKSFVMYDDWDPLFQSLNAPDAGMLIQAIFKHNKGEAADIEDPVLRATFNMISARLDADAERYQQICKKRSEAASDSKSKQMQANATISIQQHHDNDNDNDNENDNDKDLKKRRRFTPPTLQEVREYCLERKNKVDPEQFIDFYSSKGWKVGSQPMKDWKAAVRTWEKRDSTRQSEQKARNKFNRFEQRDYDFDALEAELLGIGGTA